MKIEATKNNKKLLEKLNIRYTVLVYQGESSFMISDKDYEKMERYMRYGRC